jgi:tetratricopeptide (TPR) repeat protein
VKAIPMPLKILFFGIILVIAFYVSYFIWDSISSESYTLDNVNEMHKEHISAVNNNKATEDLKTDLNLATLNRNVQLNVDDSTHYFDRAEYYTRLARQDLALPDYTKAIELNSENMSYYWQRGRAYWVLSQYQKALDDYDRAIKIELPRGLTRRAKQTVLSYELDKMQEERKELIKTFD